MKGGPLRCTLFHRVLDITKCKKNSLQLNIRYFCGSIAVRWACLVTCGPFKPKGESKLDDSNKSGPLFIGRVALN